VKIFRSRLFIVIAEEALVATVVPALLLAKTKLKSS
jgi:hypothetical protein